MNVQSWTHHRRSKSGSGGRWFLVGVIFASIAMALSVGTERVGAEELQPRFKLLSASQDPKATAATPTGEAVSPSVDLPPAYLPTAVSVPLPAAYVSTAAAVSKGAKHELPPAFVPGESELPPAFFPANAVEPRAASRGTCSLLRRSVDLEQEFAAADAKPILGPKMDSPTKGVSNPSLAFDSPPIGGPLLLSPEPGHPHSIQTVPSSEPDASILNAGEQIGIGFESEEDRQFYSDLLQHPPLGLGNPNEPQMGPTPPTQTACWWRAFTSKPLRSSVDVRDISVNSLISAALKYSAQVRVISDTPLIRDTAIIESDATFDWAGFMETNWYDTNEPVGSTLTTGGPERFENQLFEYEYGLRKQTASGGQVEVGQRYGYEDSNSIFFTPNNQGTSRLTLSYTQPLLRGAGRIYNTSVVLLAQIESGAAPMNSRASCKSICWKLPDPTGPFTSSTAPDSKTTSF